MPKPKFDPSQPFESADKPKFDPNQAFEPVEERSVASDDEQSNLDSALETLHDAGLGAVQGATFGFGDEIAGGLGAAKDVATGKSTLENIMEAYRQNRDSARQAIQEAEERSPTAATIGNIAGGIVPGLLTAGAGSAPAATTALTRILNAAKIGGKAGLVAGLGNSEADLTKGDINQVLDAGKDTLVGGGMGALVGGTLQGGIETAKGIKNAGKAIAKAVGKTEVAQNLKKSFDYGKEGVDLVTKEGLKAAEKGATTKGEELGLALRNTNKEAGEAVGQAADNFSKSGKTVDLSEEIDELKNTIAQLNKSNNPDAVADADRYQKFLDNLLQGKDRTGGINPKAVDYNVAKDIQETLNVFNGTSANPKLNTNLAINNAKLRAKEIGDKLTTLSPELADANKNYAAISQAFDQLGLDAGDFVRDAQTKKIRLDPKAEQKLRNMITRFESDTQSGANAAQRINESLRLLGEADPELANALQPTISRTSEILELAKKGQQLGLLNKSTYIKGGVIQAGNRAGQVLKKISDATPQDIKMIAQDLVSKGGVGMRLAQELAGAMRKDNVGRNAAIFALQQNPEYRQMLKGYFEDEDTAK